MLSCWGVRQGCRLSTQRRVFLRLHFGQIRHVRRDSLRVSTNNIFKEFTANRWVDLRDDVDIIKKRLRYLEERHWVDKQTKRVTFEILVFNGQTEPLVTRIGFELVFSRGTKWSI
jgi:hypothetical protein